MYVNAAWDISLSSNHWLLQFIVNGLSLSLSVSFSSSLPNVCVWVCDSALRHPVSAPQLPVRGRKGRGVHIRVVGGSGVWPQSVYCLKERDFTLPPSLSLSLIPSLSISRHTQAGWRTLTESRETGGNDRTVICLKKIKKHYKSSWWFQPFVWHHTAVPRQRHVSKPVEEDCSH